MATDIEAIVKNQLQTSLTHQLDAATQAGDIAAARAAANKIAEFALQNKSPDAPSFTNVDIRKSLKEKAPWFGVDPRRSAKAVEFGKNMEPQSFKSADEFADALIKSIKEEFEDADDEPEEEEDEDEDEKPEKKVARKKTDAPSSSMARAVPRRAASGPWVKLSDAPKDIAETIKASADKFTRNATKEQRERYIATALGTAYAADQRSRGKK